MVTFQVYTEGSDPKRDKPVKELASSNRGGTMDICIFQFPLVLSVVHLDFNRFQRENTIRSGVPVIEDFLALIFGV